MKPFFYITIVVLSIFSLLLLPLAVSNCGDNGVYVGMVAGGDCDSGGGEGMSIAHLSGMMDIFLISVTVNIFLLILYWHRAARFLSVVDIISPPLFYSVRLSRQGVCSLFYLMKPHDKLLAILTKIHKRHFAWA